jgi:hypothetical protein
VHQSVYVCSFLCVRVGFSVWVHECVYGCVVRVYVCMYVFECISISVLACVSGCVCVFVWVCGCVSECVLTTFLKSLKSVISNVFIIQSDPFFHFRSLSVLRGQSCRTLLFW